MVNELMRSAVQPAALHYGSSLPSLLPQELLRNMLRRNLDSGGGGEETKPLVNTSINEPSRLLTLSPGFNSETLMIFQYGNIFKVIHG